MLSGALLLAGLPVHASPQQATPPQSSGPPPGDPSAGLRLRLDTQGLAPAQVDASQRLLDDALARLPPQFMNQLDRAVPVRWSDALPHASYGRAERTDLLLNRRLLPALTDGSAATLRSDRPHRSQRRELLATVLHELTHFLDREQRLSDDPRLLDLAGWQVKVHRRSRLADNRFVDRSPDPYELTDPEEFVAVNMEYFLLDPAYACRRPALHRWFSAYFDWSPPQDDCAAGYPFLDTSDDPDAKVVGILDPERVYQVDYLLAEGNDQLMSRWGHGMLRLVVCAPGRPRGPDCRLDLQHHLVLSFRAFVDDVQLSSWRGLTGSYPSRLFVLPLSQVVEEYTKDQLRGLRSVPLRLERDEVAGLLERAAKLHWSYDGRYYFLTNNCAVETFKLLHDGVPRLVAERLDSITPTGLMRQLREQGIADTAVLDDRREALRLGYRFDSLRERFQAMYDVARGELALPPASVEGWLDASPDARRPWLRDAGLRASAALLLLEQAAYRREVLLAREDLKRRYLDRTTDDPRFADADEQLQQVLEQSGFLSRPAELLDGQAGYGLPQHGELQWLAAEGARRRVGLQRLGEQLTAEVRELLDPAARARLDGAQANVTLLGDRLRALHEAGDGLRLP
ncbi:zinc-dependent peptidase [Lysobacter sp. F6437]|uniref:zinc-dependent peptidase n=1 Tax=Lysobacter sp. F6437 TaxID=3459296 RepID=UPI00403E1701